MLRAVTRQVGASFPRCLVTYQRRQPIDLAQARAQHAAYEAALRQLGVQVTSLPPEDTLPDAVFVEDPVVVLDEVAVLTHMGAPERRPEASSLASALARYRPVVQLDGPGVVDGGDVVRVGRTLYVGLSARTNAAGIAQLADAVSGLGYEIRTVAVDGCLHLKSACTHAGRQTLVINPQWVDRQSFTGLDFVEIDAREPFAANVLAVGETVLVSSAGPETRRRLEERGFTTLDVDISEFAKAEGALTCKCLLFED